MLCTIAFILPCDETVAFEWGMNFGLRCECLIKSLKISWSLISPISSQGIAPIEAGMV